MQKKFFFLFILIFFLISLLLFVKEPNQVDFVYADATLESIFTTSFIWYDEGGEDGVRFGHSVDTAGDVNGDGYADAIIGVPNYKIDAIAPGAAFLYLGSPTGLYDDPQSILTPMVHGVNFGVSVSSAGDINGDGFGDVIIGADNYKIDGETGAYGAAFVYYGSPSGLLTAEDDVQILLGEQKASQFGYCVSTAGDVNGDGYDDVLIGAITFSNGEVNEGKVYLYKGTSTGLEETSYWQYESNSETASLGYTISDLGDLNKDGFDDFIIGAPFYDEIHSDIGKVYVFYGASTIPALNPDWEKSGEESNDQIGNAVAGAGDVDKNGYRDILVGAKKISTVYLFYNSGSGLDALNVWHFSSDQLNSGFGFSVTGLGDVNLDGYADIAVGAPYYDDDQPMEGAVFVFSGNTNGLNSNPNWISYGNKADTEFGYSVASALDVNDDERKDIIIGAPSYRRDEKTKMGRAFTYHGLASGDITYFYTFLPLTIK